MTVHFSRAAQGMLRLIRERGRACSGWVVGTVLGHTWLVDGLFCRGDDGEVSECSRAVNAWREDLLGEFFSFSESTDPARSGGEIMLRIDSGGIEAVVGDIRVKVIENGSTDPS